MGEKKLGRPSKYDEVMVVLNVSIPKSVHDMIPPKRNINRSGWIIDAIKEKSKVENSTNA